MSAATTHKGSTVPEPQARIPPSTIVALVTTLLLWSSAFPLIRVAVRFYSPGEIALIRFAAASVAFAVYAPIVRVRAPAARHLWHIALIGLTTVVGYHLCLNYGLVHVPAGPSSVLANTAPIWTAVFAVVFLREAMRPRQWAGVFVSLAGVALIAAGRWTGARAEAALLLPAAAAVFWGANMVLQKPMLARYGVATVTVFSVWIGTLGLLPYAVGAAETARHAPLAATLAVVYLGIFPIAIAYMTWAYVLATMKASTAAGTLYLVPVLATIAAWVWLGERLTPLAIAGGMVAIGGVALVQANGR